jgi:hypothetical protein
MAAILQQIRSMESYNIFRKEEEEEEEEEEE